MRTKLITALAALLLAGSSAMAADKEVSVPFQLMNGRLAVPLEVQGQPVQALLDPLSDVTQFSPAYAASRSMRAEGAAPTGRLNNKPEQELLNISISLGGQKIDINPVVRDFQSPGPPILLGKVAFAGWVMQLDFASSTLTLHSHAGFTPPAGAVEVPIKPDVEHGNFARVPLVVDGGKPIEAYIALDGRLVAISEGAKGSLNISGAPSPHRIQIGDLPARSAPVQVATAYDGKQGSAVAFIGNQVWRGYQMWIDLDDNKLWLAPAGN